MLTVHRRSKTFRAAIAAPVLLLALAGCGSSDGGSAASPSATGAPGTGGQGGGGFGGADFTAIQDCLKAAGISLPTPSGGAGARPSGAPSNPPDFNGTPPARPSGAAGGAGAGMFQSAQVQAALKACGITMPTGQGARPTARSTS